jgi:enolase
MKISKIWGMQILDSRGFPTVKCFLELENGNIVSASVPAGASVGKFEAIELRDGDKDKYFGKGVLRAIENINKKIAPAIVGKEPEVKVLDKVLLELDGTENKSSLGANSILAVSMAVARAQALSEKLDLYQLIAKIFDTQKTSLPKCMFNVLNGGAHADNGIEFQEFMIMPMGDDYTQNLHMASVVYHNLKKLLKDSGYLTNVGDEGGFAPGFGNGKEKAEHKALDFLVKAVQVSGFELGKDIVFCLDVAASQFYDSKEKVYLLNHKKLNINDMISYYEGLISSYPIYSIEDGLDEQDWDGWKSLTEVLGSRVQLVGDDIFVTNPKLVQKGIDQEIANAVLIKPNQIGSVTETLSAIKMAQDANYKTVVSHRSGETTDTFIADLVVGVNAGQFKSGAPARGERVAKYNRLLEI